MITNNIKENCVICYEELSQKIHKCKTCKKEFHLDCINKWLKRNNSCPICRTSVIHEGNNNNSTETDIYYDYFFDHEDIVLFDESLFLSVMLKYYSEIFFDLIKSVIQMIIYTFLFFVSFIILIQFYCYITLILENKTITI